jgi:hypothetical protein
MSIEDDQSITLSSPSGRLSLEDVPPQLSSLVRGQIISATGAQSETAETSTPMTLRLSLIHSLTTAIGADLRLIQNDDVGYEITVQMHNPEQLTAIAAE